MHLKFQTVMQINHDDYLDFIKFRLGLTEGQIFLLSSEVFNENDFPDNGSWNVIDIDSMKQMIGKYVEPEPFTLSSGRQISCLEDIEQLAKNPDKDQMIKDLIECACEHDAFPLLDMLYYLAGGPLPMNYDLILVHFSW